MKNRETLLVKRIVRRLKKEVGGRWVKIWGGPFQEAGLPDLFGCVDGILFALEVKTPTGRPSELQLQVIKEYSEVGACAAIVRSPEYAVRLVKFYLEEGHAQYLTTRKASILPEERVSEGDKKRGVRSNRRNRDGKDRNVSRDGRNSKSKRSRKKVAGDRASNRRINTVAKRDIKTPARF